MRRAAPVFGQVKFKFSIQPGTLSASFPSTTRIESCDVAIRPKFIDHRAKVSQVDFQCAASPARAF
jgi:hypothetical protein